MRADLIRMANQIARQFEHLPADAAATAVAGHLRLFWTPAMRAELVAGVAEDPDPYHPAVVAAAALTPTGT